MFTTIEATREGEVVKIKIKCECGTTTEYSEPYENFFVVKNEPTGEKEDWGLNFSCSNPGCNKVYIVKSNGDYKTKKQQSRISRIGPY